MQFYAKSGTPNSRTRACHDCRHCVAVVSQWCTNGAAIKRRGTAIPGTHDCPQWEPMAMLSEFPWWQRLTIRLNMNWIRYNLP